MLGNVQTRHCLEEIDEVPALIARNGCRLLDLPHDAHGNLNRALFAEQEQVARCQSHCLANNLLGRVMRLGVIKHLRDTLAGGAAIHASPPASGSTPSDTSPDKTLSTLSSLSMLATIGCA